MQIEIYSDVACPWCYITKRRLEQALEQFPHREEVELVWHSYELAPNMPARMAQSPADELIHDKGIPAEEAKRRIDGLTALAATLGITMNFDIVKLFNTRKAHELLHYARTVGKQAALKERLFRANFTEGMELGDEKVLIDVASEVGIDPVSAREVLETGRFRSEVIADEERAKNLDVQIPYMAIDARKVITGVKRAPVLLAAIQEVWDETHA
jgi:predicted DsbA family dithiol-disulfide isomerase